MFKLVPSLILLYSTQPSAPLTLESHSAHSHSLLIHSPISLNYYIHTYTLTSVLSSSSSDSLSDPGKLHTHTHTSAIMFSIHVFITIPLHILYSYMLISLHVQIVPIGNSGQQICSYGCCRNYTYTIRRKYTRGTNTHYQYTSLE